jgi:UDP-glucose 4-epimerase
MRYLVTGGAGFIGSHLTEALLTRGDAVTVLDDCSTGSLANLAGVSGHTRLVVVQGSVCDEVAVDEACAGCDAVIHLAAAVGVRRILEQQVSGIVVNLRGTEVMLRAATAHGRLPFFLASSSEVYGKLDRTPFREDDDSLLGSSDLHRWSYACGKKMDEFLALAYHRERRLPVTVGRFFNITGPRQSGAYGMVLPRFCAAARAGETLDVHGDGGQTRCFLHVADAVDAVLRLVACPAAVGQVVNIGGTEEVGMLDLARRVVAACKSHAPVRLVSYEQAFPGGGFEDLRRRVPDVTRLKNLTAWTPRCDLATIIRDCLATAGPPS